MPYINGDGTYHDRRRCRRLHNTGGRIQRIDDPGDREACAHCVDGDTADAPLGASPAEMIARGVCPWCSEYEGDHVGQHASSAHPDEWAAYKRN